MSFLSVLTDNPSAGDTSAPYTLAEYVKAGGGTFTEYVDYLHEWQDAFGSVENILAKDFVKERMIEMLRSITLTYSSYEEQHYIANIDWTNDLEIKSLIPFYSRKIVDVCKFYRNKRQEIRDIPRKNSFNGGKKSIEEIVYQKIVDYVFDNKNVIPQYQEIRNDLTISIEQYIDTYSEYFDIPRDENMQDTNRVDFDMLTANMNEVDYKYYVEARTVISGMFYAGSVYLNEIPLIAKLGLDLNQKCVGDYLAMKNTLTAHTTINLVDMTEQVALKRRLWEKYLGCDLWYAYKDNDGEVHIDVLCRAQNPTGNLLNCGTSDTATVFSKQLKLLSNIGLFFKPDKCTILKVNARTYTWELEEDRMEDDTWYVFPDPNAYGDIGTNKTAEYPLLMTYKTMYDMRNMSSGTAMDDPLIYMGDQNWRAYFSKQDEDFRLFSNEEYDYSFTKMDSQGVQVSFKQDAYGNRYALFDVLKNEHFISSTDEGGEIIEPVEEDDDTNAAAVLLNGGPILNAKKTKDFDFSVESPHERHNDYYIPNFFWSGITCKPMSISDMVSMQTVKYGKIAVSQTYYTTHNNDETP